ncbi:MAG: DUF1295 domain-containing protein [Myxococcota bacterium]
MLGEPLHDGIVLAILAMAPAVLLALVFIRAPYGRHQKGGFGPSLSARAAWVVMEIPTLVVFAWAYALGPWRGELVPLMLAALWLVHYGDRTLLYPRRIRPSGKPTAWIVAGWGFAFQVANSYVNGGWLSSEVAAYGAEWLADPRFVLGALLFVAGLVGNRWADHVLRTLRKPGETGYVIPRGGLYELVSCPNYLTETVMWWGWALATWSLPGLAFALFTSANLLPRAVSHHRWYRETFGDAYPARRKAVVPFLL